MAIKKIQAMLLLLYLILGTGIHLKNTLPLSINMMVMIGLKLETIMEMSKSMVKVATTKSPVDMVQTK